MRKALQGFIFVLGVFLAVSCSARGTVPNPTIPPTDFKTVTDLSPTEVAAVTEVPTPTPELILPRTQYLLTAILDYPGGQLVVDEKISYTNHSEDPLSEVVLVVEPNLLKGVFDLNSLTWEDESAIEGYALESQNLTLVLREPLQPQESVQIHLAFTLFLPESAGVLCFNDTQVNLSGWYPYAAPYIGGKGWISHSPGKVGEYQVSELGDYQVNIRVDGAPTGFMLAASAKAEIDQNWYRFNQTNARNFTWSGSSNYQMLESYAGNIRVRAFVFPLDLAAGQASLDTTVQALNLYSSLFGPYEHDSLTIVEAAFADGMEYDGLYFLGKEYFNAYEGKPGSYLVSISAHETAHQWWYGMITNDQAYDPWLDEALSTYSEVLFYEYRHPDLVGWWWETRVDYFSPKGWVDGSIYDFRSFRPYVNAVYLRGASFLRELRGHLGDDAFLAFLRNYFTIVHERTTIDHLGLATDEDFWAVLRDTTSTDLTSMKSQYFAQP